MQVLASFVLDGAGIGLQMIHPPADAIVFSLQLLHLELQVARFLTLVRKRREPVVPEDDAIGERDSQCSCSNRGSLAAPAEYTVAGRAR